MGKMKSKTQSEIDPVLRENYLRLEQVAIRENMCVHLPSLELEIPVKLIVDLCLFAPPILDMPRPMQKAIIYTDQVDKRATVVSFEDVRELFKYPAATDWWLVHPHAFAAFKIFQNCHPVLIEFRPDKELEEEKIEV